MKYVAATYELPTIGESSGSPSLWVTSRAKLPTTQSSNEWQQQHNAILARFRSNLRSPDAGVFRLWTLSSSGRFHHTCPYGEGSDGLCDRKLNHDIEGKHTWRLCLARFQNTQSLRNPDHSSYFLSHHRHKASIQPAGYKLFISVKRIRHRLILILYYHCGQDGWEQLQTPEPSCTCGQWKYSTEYRPTKHTAQCRTTLHDCIWYTRGFFAVPIF